MERDKGFTYLRMHITVNEDGNYQILMEEYIKNAVKEHLGSTKGIKSAVTPATGKLFRTNEESPALDKKDARRFHSIVARLLFLGNRPRRDGKLAIAFLCTRVQEPNQDD